MYNLSRTLANYKGESSRGKEKHEPFQQSEKKKHGTKRCYKDHVHTDIVYLPIRPEDHVYDVVSRNEPVRPPKINSCVVRPSTCLGESKIQMICFLTTCPV
jgi:hypothetical protein